MQTLQTLKRFRSGPPRKQIRFECLILSVFVIAALLMPVIQYTYNDVAYTLSGLTFLFGSSISGGSVIVETSVLIWAILAAAVASAVISILAFKLDRRIVAASQIILAFVVGVAAIAFSMQAENILSDAGARRVGILWGHYSFVILAMLMLLCGLYMLYQDGLIPRTFDVAALGVAVAASLTAPFATYTYKRVSHPLTGFDMLTNKVINNDGDVTSTNIFPVVIICCAIAIIILALARLKRRRLVAGLLILASTIVIVCSVLMSDRADSMLEEAVGASSSFLSLIPIVLAGCVFARALYILYLEKSLSPLDFMTVPGMIYLLINNYIPMVGLTLAFKDIDYSLGIWNSPWCGFDNFTYLFQSGTLAKLLTNTLLYNVVFLVLGLFTGMVVGICLFAVAKRIVRTFYQTAILLPQLISIIVVSYIVYGFLAPSTGFVNNTILGGVTTNWYTMEGIWPFLLTFINNWKQLGYNSIIFLSSIVGIDKGLYEAAMVDGCGPWKQITKITIPQLKPTIITLGLLQLGKVFYSDFGLFYQVTLGNGALYDVTNTIDVYVYRSLMVLNDMSNSMAASAFQAVCGFILVMVVNQIVRKLDRDNALF